MPNDEGDEAPISDTSAHANASRKRSRSRGAAAASSSHQMHPDWIITIEDDDEKKYESLPMPRPVPVKAKVEKVVEVRRTVRKVEKAEKVVCKNPSHEDCPGFSPACVGQKVKNFGEWQVFVNKRIEQKQTGDALTDTESEKTQSDETNAAGIHEYEETQQVEF